MDHDETGVAADMYDFLQQFFKGHRSVRRSYAAAAAALTAAAVFFFLTAAAAALCCCVRARSQYANLPFYAFGESYAGHYVPAVTHLVWQNNNNLPAGAIKINLKGPCY